jgi:hypothetical protein
MLTGTTFLVWPTPWVLVVHPDEKFDHLVVSGVFPWRPKPRSAALHSR